MAVHIRTLHELNADGAAPPTPAERRALIDECCPTFSVPSGRTYGGACTYDEDGRKILTPNTYAALRVGQDPVKTS